MCGIIGIASTKAVTERQWLAQGRDNMQHRGPDDAGEFWSLDQRVGFAHRRLSILDLSHAGHQPMASADLGVVVVLNGEIYNYVELRSELCAQGVRFYSQSDTEVVLEAYRAWGPGCLTRLNGMFALAIYDKRNASVLLARDRAGEKPLFYSTAHGALAFASELKALLAAPSIGRRVNHIALDCYLSEGFIPGDLCILQGVSKLQPAHALLYSFETGESENYRYWAIPAEDLTGLSREALPEELERLLQDAVRRQLVSDVPLGVLLSGGVDSSLITAFAARAVPRLKTFTVRFPGYGKFDETLHARLIANHFGTEHIELDAGVASTELLPILARQFDEPMADSSTIPTFLVSQLIKQHCTVALGGDGGDELFGGYPHYSRLLWLRRWIQRIPRILRSVGATAGEAMLPMGFKGRNWLQSLRGDFDNGVPLPTSLFDLPHRAALLNGNAGALGASELLRSARMPKTADLLRRATIFDFENYLADDILVKVDRASMLNGLEIRAPFLDYRVIEFAFRNVPSDMKASIGMRKILLRKLSEKVLPKEFDRERKQGFSAPLATWLSGGAWHDFFRDVLLDRQQVLFDHNCIQRMLEGQRQGLNHDERLYALLLFELWRREYRISVV